MPRRICGASLALLAAALIAIALIGFDAVTPAPRKSFGGAASIFAVWTGLAIFLASLVVLSARRAASQGLWLLLGGLALLVLGSGPLAAIGVAARMGYTTDPDPNPVLLGILAFITLPPAILLIAVGAVVLGVSWFRRG